MSKQKKKKFNDWEDEDIGQLKRDFWAFIAVIVMVLGIWGYIWIIAAGV